MMKSVAMALALLAGTLYLVSEAAYAQGGRGGGGHPGRGSSGAGMAGPGMRGGGHPMGMPSEEMPMPSQRGKQGEPGEHPMGPGPHQANGPQMGQRPTLGQPLERNTKLASRLQGVLPEGTNLPEASAGFKNLGDFVAAAHVSHNLGIPFGDLKTRITTGKSLGEAIHELRPSVDHNAEARKAQEQAKKDLQESRS